LSKTPTAADKAASPAVAWVGGWQATRSTAIAMPKVHEKYHILFSFTLLVQ